MKFQKYHGAGNDFLVADNREGDISLSATQIQHLCNRHTGFGADGVILLENSKDKAFSMVFYNPDGSGGMMCGNGGRCIVAYAVDLGVATSDSEIEFDAPDGPHSAIVLEGKQGSPVKTVKLKMKDVSGIERFPSESAFFLDTGTRHLVKFVSDIENYPVVSEGKVLRHDPRFAPIGTNVNFVEPIKTDKGLILKVRTYEKGVEDETLACGTGIVATSLAAFAAGYEGNQIEEKRHFFDVESAISRLKVDFVIMDEKLFHAEDVWLTGPAEVVGSVSIYD